MVLVVNTVPCPKCNQPVVAGVVNDLGRNILLWIDPVPDKRAWLALTGPGLKFTRRKFGDPSEHFWEHTCASSKSVLH